MCKSFEAHPRQGDTAVPRLEITVARETEPIGWLSPEAFRRQCVQQGRLHLLALIEIFIEEK
jgi:hypothetical protein